MIVKHVAMRTVRKSSFADLAGYLTHPQDNSERLGAVSITHCHSTTLDDALVEIQAVQSCNTRSTDDKTYHLVVSFRAEEQPSKEVLRAIEQQVCDGLGFGEHQRVSAVHGDTDHLHIHIAINKIHPTRYTVHTPFNAYWTLARLCERLEIEHGLQRDNHRAQKLGPENRAADMERHSGIQSLIGWVQAECLDRLTTASSWAVLHETLREHGLAINERGNGFVIGDGAGTQAKASSIDRSLSRGRLEERLGPFEPARQSPAERQFNASNATGPSSDRPRYDKKPARSRVDTTELYAQYQQEREAMAVVRKAESRILRQRQVAQVGAVQDASRVRRSAIRLMGGDRLARKVLYALASRASKSDLAKVRKEHALERRAHQQQYVRRVWADWLRARAAQGDPVALGALRAQGSHQGLKGNVLSASRQEEVTTSGPKARPDHVTKTGTVIYYRGTSAIRDDGDCLQVARGTDWQGLDAALRLAVQRYGNRLTVAGTDDFKSRVVAAAAAAALPLTFSDAALEQRRLALSFSLSQKPAHDPPDRRRPQAGGTGLAQPGATHGGRAEHAELEPGAGVRRLGPESEAQSVKEGFGSASTASSPADHRTIQRGKPHVGRIGSQPPPAAKNRLRNLSQLGVVELARGGEVLLPNDVPGRLEQPGPQPDHALRRPVPSAGEGVEATASVIAEDAIGKFIAERDAKRSCIDDIPKYRRFIETVETSGHYAGTRSIDGQLLALLQREDAVDVIPIDAATALRLKRFRIGDAITVAPHAHMTDQPTDSTPVPTYTFKPQTGQKTTLQKRRSR